MRLDRISNEKLPVYETWSRNVVVLARVFFWKWAPSQLECKSSECARMQLIGYEINLLNKVWQYIYIYWKIFTISSEKAWVYKTCQKTWKDNSLWDMVTRCCGFRGGIFLKVSSLSATMLTLEDARAHALNWLRDQPFEQGMIICI